MKSYSVKRPRSLVWIGLVLGVAPLGLGNAMLSTSVNVTASGENCANTGTTFAGCNMDFWEYDSSGSRNFIGAGAIAVAHYKSLFAGTLVTATSNISFFATATAMSLDTLTILGGSGTGYIRFLYDGNFTSLTAGSPPLGNQPNLLSFQDNAFPAESFGSGGNDKTNQPFVFQTMLYPFTFGVPFTIQVSADAITNGPGDAFGRGAIDVNYVEANIFDQSHNPDSAAYIISESGTNYAFPEPTSFVLLATLVAALGGVRYWKRSRSLAS